MSVPGMPADWPGHVSTSGLRIEAEEAVERVRALHYSVASDGHEVWCGHCGHAWPCPTLLALGVDDA